MPKVSVIVPVYNVEPYLRRSMDCLLNQTLKDIEFICIDDFSTDRSLDILREYESKDSRFKIITSEKNGGAAVARNKGLDIAQGEYLGFMDPDDAIDLNYYEELYKKAKEQDYDIVKCLRKTINSDGTSSVSGLNKKIKKNKYYFSNEWQTAIYKSSIVHENGIRFNDEIIKAQDILFLNKFILHAKTISLVEGVYYNYYIRTDSLNSQHLSEKKFVSALKAISISLTDINELVPRDKPKIYNQLYTIRFNSFFYILYKNNDYALRKMWAEYVMKSWIECKNKKFLSKNIIYKSLIPALKSENTKELLEIINKCNSLIELRALSKNVGFIKKIFLLCINKMNVK